MALAILVIVAFNAFLQIERWLHQHIFKVGWLVTKNFQTTTILYYTFFLPGIVIYELALWLTAGALNVRADRAFEWPEQQEIGELKLNFVQVSRKAPKWKVTIIYLSPLVAGMAIIWLIAVNMFDLFAVFETMNSGRLADIQDGIGEITGTTDFWLWAYILFAVTNTMLPDPGILKGWQWLVVAGGIASIPFFLLGVGDQVVGGAIVGPIAGGLEVLILIFVVAITFNVVGVALLSFIENSIEYITGDSATFKNGKMIVMTRAEAIEQRRKDREVSRRRQQQSRRVAASVSSGPPSVYKLEFPIPGPPGKEPVSSIRTRILMDGDEEASSVRPRRAEPSVISGDRRGDDDRRIAPPPDDMVDEADKSAEPEREIRFGGVFARDDEDDDQGSTDDITEEAASSRISPFSRPSSSDDSDRSPRSSELSARRALTDDDQDEDEAAESLRSVRQRPSPFSRSSSSDDKNSNSRLSRSPNRSSELSARRALTDDDQDEDDDDESDESKSTARPSPFSRSSSGDDENSNSRPSRSPNRSSELSARRALTDDDQDEDEAAESLRSSRPRPSPFSTSRSSGFDKRPQTDRSSSLRESLRRFSQDTEDYSEMDDEITYEDIDDSI